MKKRILIVEDQRSVFLSLTAALGANSYEVIWAQTAHEALRRSLDVLFDLVILDLSLCDMDGWKALEWFNRLHPFLPIITLCDLPEQSEQAAFLGARAFIEKPCDQTQLLKTIDGLLAESHEDYFSRLRDPLSGTIRIPNEHLVLAK